MNGLGERIPLYVGPASCANPLDSGRVGNRNGTPLGLGSGKDKDRDLLP